MNPHKYFDLVGTFSLFLTTAALLSLSVSVLHSEPRTFTNTAGKEVVAEMVGATATTVTLKMGNGKNITANTSMFSKDDQTFIAEWLKKNPSQIDYRIEIDFSKKRLGKTKRRGSAVTLTDEEWIYKVKIKNLSKNGQTNATVTGLKATYKIYRTRVADARMLVSKDTSGTTAADGKYLVTTETKNLADIQYLKETGFETSPVILTKSELDAGFFYPGGGKDNKKDELSGIWVKIYHNDKVVAERQSGSAKANKVVWRD